MHLDRLDSLLRAQEVHSTPWLGAVADDRREGGEPRAERRRGALPGPARGSGGAPSGAYDHWGGGVGGSKF